MNAECNVRFCVRFTLGIGNVKFLSRGRMDVDAFYTSLTASARIQVTWCGTCERRPGAVDVRRCHTHVEANPKLIFSVLNL